MFLLFDNLCKIHCCIQKCVEPKTTSKCDLVFKCFEEFVSYCLNIYKYILCGIFGVIWIRTFSQHAQTETKNKEISQIKGKSYIENAK